MTSQLTCRAFQDRALKRKITTSGECAAAAAAERRGQKEVDFVSGHFGSGTFLNLLTRLCSTTPGQDDDDDLFGLYCLFVFS